MAIINFTPSFTTPIDFTGRIVQGTKIIDVPEILNQMIAEDRQYFLDNFQANFSDMVAPISTYFDDLIAQNNVDLKNEILAQVINITPDNTYDIAVTNAANALHAGDADTLTGKTVDDIWNQIRGEIPLYTVVNAEHLENKTLTEILALVPDILVNNANNATLFNSKTVDEIKTEIKNEILNSSTGGVNASALEGKTLSEILNTVQTSIESSGGGWTAYRAATFGGETPLEWEAKISGGTVAVALDSQKLVGKTLAEIDAMWAADIQTATDGYLINYDATITNKIKTTVVDNAINTTLFDNDDRTTWLNTIKTTVIDNAVNSTLFDGDDRATWITTIKNTILNYTDFMTVIENNVTGVWTALAAQTASTAALANSLETTYRTAIIDEAAVYVGTLPAYIDALKLEGKTVQDIINLVSVSASSDIIAKGATLVQAAGSPINDDLLNIAEMHMYQTEYNLEILSKRLSELVISTYGVADGGIRKQPYVFDPDALNVWSKIDVEYNTSGQPSKKSFYAFFDEKNTILNGYALEKYTEGYSAKISGVDIPFELGYQPNSIVTLIGSGQTANDIVDVVFRDGTVATTTVLADGTWTIDSTQPQIRFRDQPTLPFNPAELKVIEVYYTYANDLIQKKSINHVFTNLTIFDINYSYNWNAIPFKTSTILSADIIGNQISTNGVSTEYFEMYGEPVKKITTTTVTNNIVYEQADIGNAINIDPNDKVYIETSYSFANWAVGDVVTINYTIENLGLDLTNVSITESNPNITITGTIATLTSGTVDNATVSGAYTLTAEDIKTGRLPETVTMVSATNSNTVDVLLKSQEKVEKSTITIVEEWFKLDNNLGYITTTIY